MSGDPVSSYPVIILLLTVVCCLPLAQAFLCPTCNSTCHCNCNNVTKLVNCASQTLASIPVDLPDDVVHLDLSNNKISDLRGLTNFSKLVSLQLSHNQISKWNKTWLTGLPSLKDLKLSQNQLTEPPEPLCSRLPALQHLYLDNNKLDKSFSMDYSHCTSLGRLTLSDNPYSIMDNSTLCSLAGQKEQNKPVQPLSLKLNRLKLVRVQPGSLACLGTRLHSLDLSQNALPQASLEGLIGGSCLSKLKTLNLRRSSKLQAVTDALMNCSSLLETLMLDDNSNVTVLHETALALTKNLHFLYLNKTGVSNWTSGCFDQLHNLRSLSLSFTPVATIGGRNGSDSNPLSLLNKNDSSLKNLSLTNALLVCDCSLYWLWQQLRDSPLVRSRIVGGADSLKCAGPPGARGSRLMQFNGLSTCADNNNNGGFFTRQMVIILASSGAGALILIGVIVFAVTLIRRRSTQADSSQEPPRLTFSGASSAASSVDDLRDPLVRPEVHRRGRDSIWIRLRRLLRERRNSSAQAAPVRPPIFDPQPEEYLSADA